MERWFSDLNPVLQAFLATVFTWGLTALGAAAGAMIFVVVEELIPESQCAKNTDVATLGLMGGFTVMMTLDVAFG